MLKKKKHGLKPKNDPDITKKHILKKKHGLKPKNYPDFSDFAAFSDFFTDVF